jgi:hypothetical protein
VVARQTKDTQANVPSELGCEGNKQNVPKIMSAVHICVSRLPKELLRQVCFHFITTVFISVRNILSAKVWVFGKM